jgi:hypothetical protein
MDLCENSQEITYTESSISIIYHWKALFEQCEALKREKMLVWQQKRECTLKNAEEP